MKTTIQTNAKTVDANDSVQHAAQIISDNNLRYVYVTEDNKLKGVVSLGDITKNLVAKGKDPSTKVSEIMNECEHVKDDNEDEYAYALMRKYHTLNCPVVDKEGIFKGVVCFDDVCVTINQKIKDES